MLPQRGGVAAHSRVFENQSAKHTERIGDEEKSSALVDIRQRLIAQGALISAAVIQSGDGTLPISEQCEVRRQQRECR